MERLATAIKLGFLAPGSQLPPERELARQLEISRTTLRQALTALTQSGALLVRQPPYRAGTSVILAVWHGRNDHDPAHAWLRDMVVTTAGNAGPLRT